MIVTGWRIKAESRWWEAEGHDFSQVLGGFWQFLPSTLTTVTLSTVVRVSNPSLRLLHRAREGWVWESHSPELFPPPPFLVTDDDEFNTVFCGNVGIRLTAQASRWVDGECELVGEFCEPVYGEHWVGVIRMGPDSRTMAELMAFSRTGGLPPQNINKTTLLTNEVELGELIFSAPAASTREDFENDKRTKTDEKAADDVS